MRGCSTLLERAPCDVGVLVGGASGRAVLVPFAGAEHDWAAVELGAWLARNRGTPLRLAGAVDRCRGGDASRLLASASLAIQRALGVPAEPLLVEPSPEALVAAAAGAGVVFVGLTDRWRREGLGARPDGARAGPGRRRCSSAAASARVASPRGGARRASRGRSPADALATRAQGGGVAFAAGSDSPGPAAVCSREARRRSARRPASC